MPHLRDFRTLGLALICIDRNTCCRALTWMDLEDVVRQSPVVAVGQTHLNLRHSFGHDEFPDRASYFDYPSRSVEQLLLTLPSVRGIGMVCFVDDQGSCSRSPHCWLFQNFAVFLALQVRSTRPVVRIFLRFA